MRSSFLSVLFILFVATHSAHADLLGGLLGSSSGGGLLGGKGIAVTASYATKVRVHANIAANIALDLPTTGGLLSPVTGLLGGELTDSSSSSDHDRRRSVCGTAVGKPPIVIDGSHGEGMR